jgi:hypothetical protein
LKAAVLELNGLSRKSAGRTGPDEGQRRANAALRVAGRRVTLFGGIPRNVYAVVAVKNIEHFCTSMSKLLLPLKCALCLMFDQEISPQRVAFTVITHANLHGRYAKATCLP